MPLLNPSDEKAVHSARRLCELFRGRFSQDVALKLIEDFGGELQAVDFILNEKQDVVSQHLMQNEDYVKDLRADSKKIADLLENGIEYETRQFACADCVSSWWKKVPSRKQVSKCRRCKTKYDPVPQDKEWGWGKFVCACSNEFHAYGEMGLTYSECYKCGNQVPVDRILPPRRRIGSRKKSNKPHSCNGVNCFGHDDHPDLYGGASASMNMTSLNSQHHSQNNTYNFSANAAPGSSSQGQRRRGKSKKGVKSSEDSDSSTAASGQNDQGKVPVCIHPSSNKKGGRKIRTPSKKHISTGSTVNTFLTQGSLDTATVSVAFTLDSIVE